jgi:hypothetical protein
MAAPNKICDDRFHGCDAAQWENGPDTYSN